MFLLWDFLWLWRHCLPRGIEDLVYREILTCFCEFFSQAIFKYTLLSYQPRDGNLETAGVACQRNTCDNFAMLESCGVILCCSLCYLCIAVCLERCPNWEVAAWGAGYPLPVPKGYVCGQSGGQRKGSTAELVLTLQQNLWGKGITTVL